MRVISPSTSYFLQVVIIADFGFIAVGRGLRAIETGTEKTIIIEDGE